MSSVPGRRRRLVSVEKLVLLLRGAVRTSRAAAFAQALSVHLSVEAAPQERKLGPFLVLVLF